MVLVFPFFHPSSVKKNDAEKLCSSQIDSTRSKALYVRPYVHTRYTGNYTRVEEEAMKRCRQHRREVGGLQLGDL